MDVLNITDFTISLFLSFLISVLVICISGGAISFSAHARTCLCSRRRFILFHPQVVIFSRVKELIKFSLFLVSEWNFSDDILSLALFAPRSVYPQVIFFFQIFFRWCFLVVNGQVFVFDTVSKLHVRRNMLAHTLLGTSSSQKYTLRWKGPNLPVSQNLSRD